MQNIGRYKVLREIGRGGMGIVYKAVDPSTKKDVAIKVLHPSMVDRTSVERFNREGRAMAKLKHPNIVEVVDFGAQEGTHFFAMEYIEGKSLKWMISEEGTLPLQKTLNIIKQVAQALAYAHAEGMIHRDIKPANVMIDRNGVAKVMDFGLVQIPGVTRVTGTDTAVGTPEYISPEQLSGEEVDNRTDIYSLGITMYEMVAGTTPFKGETSYAVLMKHKYETPPPLKTFRGDVPREIEDIVMKAIAKDLGKRYLRVEEFMADIDRVLGLKETKPSPENKTEEVVKEKEKKGFLKLLMPALCIIIILTVVFLAYRYLKDNKPKIKEKDLMEETLKKLKELENAQDTYKKR